MWVTACKLSACGCALALLRVVKYWIRRHFAVVTDFGSDSALIKVMGCDPTHFDRWTLEGQREVGFGQSRTHSDSNSWNSHRHVDKLGSISSTVHSAILLTLCYVGGTACLCLQVTTFRLKMEINFFPVYWLIAVSHQTTLCHIPKGKR